MAKLILDKATDNEVVFDIDTFREQVLPVTLTAEKRYFLESGEIIPDIPTIKSEYFEAIEVLSDEDILIPIVGNYGKIASFSTRMDEDSKVFTYTIELRQKELGSSNPADFGLDVTE